MPKKAKKGKKEQTASNAPDYNAPDYTNLHNRTRTPNLRTHNLRTPMFNNPNTINYSPIKSSYELLYDNLSEENKKKLHILRKLDNSFNNFCILFNTILFSIKNRSLSPEALAIQRVFQLLFDFNLIKNQSFLSEMKALEWDVYNDNFYPTLANWEHIAFSLYTHGGKHYKYKIRNTRKRSTRRR